MGVGVATFAQVGAMVLGFWGDNPVSSCRPCSPDKGPGAMVLARFQWHVYYLERFQGVLDVSARDPLI
jgi:hypothetical protein